MKRSVLLASLMLLVAALAGCAHPNDLTEEVASAAGAAVRAAA